MSDNQDSEHFSYNRTWEEILTMLDKAERRQNHFFSKLQRTKDKKERMRCMRNYKALEGVVKALRWTLGDKNIEHPLE
jgi:seryl-tRNA synthetase